MIDEYDNFTNTILSTEGKEKYHEMTRGVGFFRYFFNILKGITSGSGEKNVRLFITGVSPITMDDVTNGFNIGSNISLDERFNEIMGFTKSEVQDMISYYQGKENFPLDLEETMSLMKKWYDQYRFAKRASESIFNSTMVLYFVKQVTQTGRIPDELIDHNVQMDYEKLRHLITIGKSLNGNFDRLKRLIEEGKVQMNEVAVSFSLEKLTHSRNFYSLLFYFGLLTFAKNKDRDWYLRIPNQTVQRLMFSYIRDAYEEIGCFQIDPWEFSQMIRKMAYQGEWKAVFEFLAQEIDKQTFGDFVGFARLSLH